MATNPSIQKTDLVSFEVKVSGNSISDSISVLSIEIDFSINRVANARVVVLDGDAATGTFQVSSSNTFKPGNTITIYGGYQSQNKLLFSGIIVNQNIRTNPTEGSVLEVWCRDQAIATTVGRKSAMFTNKTDSDVISTILGNYSGIKASVVTTSNQIPQLVQYYTGDWDFILSRAEANSLVVSNVNGTIAVIDPTANTDPVLNLEYGTDILEFNGDLNAVYQLGNVKASAWDYATQEVISGEASNTLAGAGNLSSDSLSKVIGLETFQLQSSAALDQAALNGWSKAQMIKSEFSKIRGEVKCQGNSLVTLGNYIALSGLGDRFNGSHFVSGVFHDISDGNWITEVTFGLSPQWFTEAPDIMAPPAAALLPGIQGLFTATVKKMYEDPDAQYRILVDVPFLGTSGEGLWARLGTFYATSNAGAFFLPEVGDEVVVGFLNEDPRYPIILGSLYSSDKLKPYQDLEPNEKNTIKAIVSKSGIQMTFDDENKIFTILTPQKNTIVLSDKDQKITIQDQNENSIVLSSDGIVIKSPKDITVEADQNLNLKGTQGVSIASSAGDITINGMNIKESAEVEYSAEGSASASVQGGGELTLKGAMVMIN
ncbi:MAG TPA: type VI secretion system tip protein VgrG [Flavobacteriaceae bacterium]|nr:type VI secretion system tip protein VgrG [Flavobacteriaceae bacterium]MCB9214031.1 type VI secretion system tip protein VgrG [Alteromonas sp.]HPF10824.1 type VI secretion system tip protein VgrG [Flavobacteriaceae bacterium]HQU20967.1 type VI secretion system tip protein VgrG [Flavobacteriaceae bacterium]HQU65544.1 type VI secretion system tip protein VgrG [Flavobacteriaceae bacterium]